METRTGKEDARVQRTRRKLKGAIVALMGRKSADAVSITELCAAAGVNRNTFYSHYSEPGDVLKDIEADLMDKLWATLKTVDRAGLDVKAFVSKLLEVIDGDRAVCSAILGANSNRGFVNGLVDTLHDKVVASWVAAGMSPEEADVTYHYSVSGCLGVIESWVAGGFRTNVAELGAMITGLLETGKASGAKA